MRHRILALAVLLGLFLLLPAQSHSATVSVEVIAQSTDAASTQPLSEVHPSAVASLSEEGECFQLVQKAKLVKVQYDLQRAGDPFGSMGAFIFQTTGTLGSNCTPTGSALVASSEIQPGSLSTSRTIVDFPFGSFTLTPGTYAISLRAISGTWDGSNLVRFRRDSTSTYSGNGYLFYSSAYSTTGADATDNYFVLWGEIEVTGTGPAGTQDPSTEPEALPTGPLAGGIGALVILAGFVAFAFSRRRGR